MSEPEAVEPAPQTDDVVLAAMHAAIRAFVAARDARVLLDTPGRLGANAVSRSGTISGARRASNKAQAKVEGAARQLEEARDRWGALARGLAADRDVEPGELARLVGRATTELSLQDAVTALRRGLAAATAGPDDGDAIPARLRAALAALEGAD
ncbi:MAG: hypothetical protein ACYDHB_01825 [Candidatus Dormibacteria bacterium]